MEAAQAPEVQPKIWVSPMLPEIPPREGWGPSPHSFSFRLPQPEKNPSIGENMEKRERSYTAGEIVNWYSYHGKQNQGSSKNKK